MGKVVLTALVGAIAFLCGPAISRAQTALGPQVTGAAGGSAVLNGGRVVHFTVGEPFVATITASSAAITQGFNQPSANEPLQFELNIFPASCPSATDGSARVDSITGCIPPYSISWSNGTSQTEADRLAPAEYTVTVAAGNPPVCTVTRTFTIPSGPEALCRLRIFNAFSPNGDGRNDVWEIENIHLPEFATNYVEIYNRWGQLVWSAANYNNHEAAWDGRSNSGIRLPDGTYYYHVQVGATTLNGYVEITR